MRSLFKGPHAGHLKILTLQDGLDKIAELEKKYSGKIKDAEERISELEKAIRTLEAAFENRV